MAFLETPRFPDGIAYGAVGGPGYNTDVVFLPSGQEARNIARQDGLCAWDVSHGVKDAADWAALLAFFRIAKGRGNTFRYRDSMDHSATAAEGKLTLLTSTTWQMVKRYTAGSGTEDRLIQKPVSGSITVSGGGVYTIDTTTGIITKVSGADPTAWAGEFDVPCRFDIDVMKATHEAYGLVSWGGIPIVEVPL